MRLIRSLYCLALLLLLLNPSAGAEEFSSPECRPLVLDAAGYTGPSKYNSGLLWKVARPGQIPSYVFGTIHVADEAILDLPVVVKNALENSDSFVMEALPDPAQAMLLIGMMYFSDGKKLSDLLSQKLFGRTVEILSAYHLTEEAIVSMKPWAAFITMNYPAEFGTVLDVELLKLAQRKAIKVYGLETLEEQGNILNSLEYDSQVRLLIDTVCHYDVVVDDIEMMKKLYLKRDLKGLFEFSHRYSIADDAVYKVLMKKLLTERNYIMAERMQPILEDGNAFIAIGAMHLPGKEGVLNLLKQRGYNISLLY